MSNAMGLRVWAACSIVAMALMLWSAPARALASVAGGNTSVQSNDALSVSAAPSDSGNKGGNGKGRGKGTTTTSSTTTSTTITTTTTTTITPPEGPPPAPVSTTTTEPTTTTTMTGGPGSPGTTPPAPTTTTSRLDDTVGPAIPSTTLGPETTATTRQEKTRAGGASAGTNDAGGAGPGPIADVVEPEEGMASFLNDEAEDMAVPASPEPAPGMSALRIASDWTWFEAGFADGDSAPAAAFRVFEAVGRALVTAGEGMAAPASATVTVLSMIYVSRRRIGRSVLPSQDVEGLDVNEPMFVLR